MADAQNVTRVRPSDRETAGPTPGKVREQAIDVDGMWSGLVRSEPGADGDRFVEAEPGDFLHIPKHLVHREGNSGFAPAQEIVTRSGTGTVTINVEGPTAAS